MILKTERLLLRPWDEQDAEALYEYAKDPRVGPIAGWPVHTSVENSREIIKTVLSAPQTYAVCLKEACGGVAANRAIGSVGLLMGDESNIDMGPDEAEVGYWIGVPFWGKGLIPEAVRELMRYAFEEIGMQKLWCGHFDGNQKSWRVQEKCGFIHQYTNKDTLWELTNEIRTEHISCITKSQWEKKN